MPDRRLSVLLLLLLLRRGAEGGSVICMPYPWHRSDALRKLVLRLFGETEATSLRLALKGIIIGDYERYFQCLSCRKLLLCARRDDHGARQT